MPKLHELKMWPDIFHVSLHGVKPWEWRKNDRDFRVGDFLHQREWSPDTGEYTGRELWGVVTYMLTGPAFGIPDGYCIMTVMWIDKSQVDIVCENGSSHK